MILAGLCGLVAIFTLFSIPESRGEWGGLAAFVIWTLMFFGNTILFTSRPHSKLSPTRLLLIMSLWLAGNASLSYGLANMSAELADGRFFGKGILYILMGIVVAIIAPLIHNSHMEEVESEQQNHNSGMYTVASVLSTILFVNIGITILFQIITWFTHHL